MDQSPKCNLLIISQATHISPIPLVLSEAVLLLKTFNFQDRRNFPKEVLKEITSLLTIDIVVLCI